jgi:cellulose synthase/poly-beta-1,6-N-acetylglucosamine synthase-like glycosyltransferase
MEAASGEIVAYIDDDAYPDPHWLYYLANGFLDGDCVGVGGPNIACPEDGWISECTDNAPGNPIHVLISDREAEQIPGCNMAFRKSALQAIGGFDPQFRAAGDDVDVCWRMRQAGGRLGFAPGAVVWHHRRDSIGTYLKQQGGYGKAEALLAGRLYGKGFTRMIRFRGGRVYQGSWGAALFQSMYQPAPGIFWSLPLMPEWYLLILVLAALSLIGIFWTPLLLALPVLIFAVAAPLVQAAFAWPFAPWSHSLAIAWPTPARGTPHANVRDLEREVEGVR